MAMKIRDMSNPGNKARGVRARNDVLEELELRGGMRSSVMNDALEKYLALVRRTWARGDVAFTPSEIGAIWEALFTPHSPIGMRDIWLAWLVIEKGFESVPGIEERWGVKGKALAERLQHAPPAVVVALLDGYDRWLVKLGLGSGTAELAELLEKRDNFELWRRKLPAPPGSLELVEDIMREGGARI